MMVTLWDDTTLDGGIRVFDDVLQDTSLFLTDKRHRPADMNRFKSERRRNFGWQGHWAIATPLSVDSNPASSTENNETRVIERSRPYGLPQLLLHTNTAH